MVRAKRLLPLDTALRAWLMANIRHQQLALGAELEKAGVVTENGGQPWVSKYINKTEAAPASIDHLVVIAAYFKMSVPALLAEIGALGGPAATARSEQRRADADRFARLRELSDRLKEAVADIAPSTETPVRHHGTTGGRRTTREPSPRRTEPKNKGR